MYYVEHKKSKISILFCDSVRENSHLDPIAAVQEAVALFNQKKNDSKISFQIDTSSQSFKTSLSSRLIKWASEEYKTLPKCQICWNVIAYSGNGCCSEVCLQKKTKAEFDRDHDNEETEFYL